MLKKEFEFYLQHQAELVEKYNNQYLLIKDQKVIGAYKDQKEAYLEAVKKFNPGSFLIQYCSPGKEGYTQTFHSRVSF